MRSPLQRHTFLSSMQPWAPQGPPFAAPHARAQTRPAAAKAATEEDTLISGEQRPRPLDNAMQILASLACVTSPAGRLPPFS